MQTVFTDSGTIVKPNKEHKQILLCHSPSLIQTMEVLEVTYCYKMFSFNNWIDNKEINYADWVDFQTTMCIATMGQP